MKKLLSILALSTALLAQNQIDRTRQEKGTLPASALAGIFTTKGDTLGFSTSVIRVPVGNDGFCFVADSTQASGVKWAACPGGTAQVNGTNISTQNPFNFQNGTGTTVTNPSAGNIQVAVVYGSGASTAAQGNDARITGAEQTSNKGVASGYAGLDGAAHQLCAQEPALTGDVTSPAGSCAMTLPNVATAGTGLKTTINAKGQATGVATAATTDLSDNSVIVKNNQANTYTAGSKQTVQANATTAGFNFAGVSADPSSLANGDAWHRSDLFHLYVRLNGATHQLATTDDNITGSSAPQSFDQILPGTNTNGGLLVGPGSNIDTAGGPITATIGKFTGATQYFIPTFTFGGGLGNSLCSTDAGITVLTCTYSGGLSIAGPGSGVETFSGATSGSASIGVGAVAGTPNKLLLSTTNGSNGQFETSDGGNPQIKSWTRYFLTNAQTGTYQVVAADFQLCKTIPVASGTFTVTLVASGSQPADGQCIRIINYGNGTVTVARSGQNINGVAVNQTIGPGTAAAPNGLWVVSNGTDYTAQPLGSGGGGSGTVTSVATTSPITGGTFTTSGTIACATCTTNASALTNNAVVLGAGSQAAKVSTTTDDGTTFTLGEQTAIASPFMITVTGDVNTVTGKMTKNSAGTVTILGTGDRTTGVSLGICQLNCGVAGSQGIAIFGLVNCIFDNASTAGHLVQASSSVAGDCKDTGQTITGNLTDASQQILGTVWVGGAAGSQQMILYPPGYTPSTTPTFTGNVQTPTLKAQGSTGSLTVQTVDSSTSSIPGKLTVRPGNSSGSGQTNQAGGLAEIDASLGSGSVIPGVLTFGGAASGTASGTTAQTLVTRETVNDTKALTSGSATTLVSIPLATLTSDGGTIHYTIEGSDNSAHLCSASGFVTFAAENTAGTFKTAVSAAAGSDVSSVCTGADTLTLSFALTGANPALLQITPTASATLSTYFRIIYTVEHFGQQAATY